MEILRCFSPNRVQYGLAPKVTMIPGSMKNQVSSGMRKCVMGSDHCGDLYSVWSATRRDTLGPMWKTANRVVKKFEIVSHKRLLKEQEKFRPEET